MRYHGTDIDGPGLDPERLEVRGVDLNELIRHETVAGSFRFILTGERTGPATEWDHRMREGFRLLPTNSPAFQAVQLAADSGAEPWRAMIAGLACLQAQSIDSASGIDAEWEGAALWFGLLPSLLLRALTGSPSKASGEDDSDFRATLLHALARRPDLPGARRAFEAVCVSFQAGFGYLTPTVMLPRVAAGTRVDLPMALISGLTGSGPAHVGACELAMRLFQTMREQGGAAAVEAVLTKWLEKAGRIPGFGHPLFREDPRVPCLRALLHELGLESPALELFDHTAAWLKEQKGLRPNIDAMSAAVFLSLELPKGSGTGLFLCMRAAAMMAHYFEKRRQPVFGATSADARKYLDSVPKTWI